VQNARNSILDGAQIQQINTNLLVWRIRSYNRLRSSKIRLLV